MRLVLWGLGKAFKKYESQIDFTNVVALIDNNKDLCGKKLHGFEIQQPQIIKKIEFDYVFIFSSNYNKEIERTLTKDYQVSKNKVICILMNYKLLEERSYARRDIVIEESMKFIKQSGYRAILDLGMGLGMGSILNRSDSRVNINKNITLDCYNYKKIKIYPLLHNLYNQIYSRIKDVSYDVVAFLHLEDVSLYDFEQVIKETYALSRYVLLNISDGGNTLQEYIEWVTYNYEKWGKVYRLFRDEVKLILIDKAPYKKDLNASIYVATHIKYPIPSNNIYIPIQAGRALNEDLGYYYVDNKADNISGLNLLLNECTVLYWIWKNTESYYVGLNHYRRYFLKNKEEFFDNIVDAETIADIMQEYDMILPCSYHEFPGTIMEGLLVGVRQDAVEKGIDLVRNIIMMRHEDYLDAFDTVFNGNTFYMCNMFITRRDILNCYCEWLFDIIIEAAENIDVSKYDPYSKRIIGFIAERLMTVWLLKNPARIKELPIIVIE
ncbi:DUF4422 domain-containing protein [Anaerocolumna jejuensis]|uniref:DUF4422 domain-containing protein n=1 Tax=Anaerocolumna jejuensis TaxID=259063 RepID=UPI003F7BBC00